MNHKLSNPFYRVTKNNYLIQKLYSIPIKSNKISCFTNISQKNLLFSQHKCKYSKKNDDDDYDDDDWLIYLPMIMLPLFILLAHH